MYLRMLAAVLLVATVSPAAVAQQQRPGAASSTNPFQRRIDMPEFPRGMEWLNSRPLRISDLKGRFVLLDFWTYCCINCIHILPELKKLEQAYPNQLVVIGVHSAKFETEKDSRNIAEAILRYEIEHPVVNDKDHQIWDMLGVQSWPTLLMIDPEGKVVWGNAGEFRFEDVDAVLKSALPYYRRQKLLDETPFHFELIANRTPADTPLRFPGKVLADSEGGRLFITDSNHNRIVVTTLQGELLEIIGAGTIGANNGGYEECQFDHPQGVALHGRTLYVADTENHLIRKVDLVRKRVTTVAGTGEQARVAWPGLERAQQRGRLPDRWVGPPKTTALNSPWALWVHDDQLYIAMAGPHQIWKMPLDESEVGPFAGNGREDIVDGPLLPQQPYELGYSSFAQPSGLTSDGERLFVADSEGSSIRIVPFQADQRVSTLTGSAQLPGGRLFAFGDADGKQPMVSYRTDAEGNVIRDARGFPVMEGVRLQHALGVAYHEGRVYIADTYNNKIKVADVETGEVRTIAGDGEPGASDSPPRFDEPAGVSIANGVLYVADTNNHLIRTLNLADGQVGTLRIPGLQPPRQPEQRPSFAKAEVRDSQPLQLRPVNDSLRLQVRLTLPPGTKINDLAPMSYWVTAEAPGPLDPSGLGKRRLEVPAAEFDVTLPVRPGASGQTTVEVALDYYYCQEEGGLCKTGSILFRAPLEVSPEGREAALLR